MRVIKTILIILIVSFGTSSCKMSSGTINASKETEERQYNLSPISNIDVSTDVTIIVSTGLTKNTIMVKGSKNVLDALILKENGKGRLTISLDHGTRFKYNSENQKAHVYIASNQIKYLTCSSGAKIEVVDTIKCSNSFMANAMTGGFIRVNGIISPFVNVKSFSGGNIILTNLISDTFSAQVYTGGFVCISGETKKVHIKGKKEFFDIKNLKTTN